jgi:fructose-1-phosphate kinase PfkB-like protein
MAKILVTGLNPAWQQVFRLPGFRPGAVNRADAFWSLGSGKGLNVAKNLARRGHEVHLLQVLAGENGRRVRAACDREGVHSLEVWTAGETRVCATLLRDGDVDEIIAPFQIADAERDAIASRLLEQVPEDCDAVIVCGSAPPGLPEDMHGRIAERAMGTTGATRAGHGGNRILVWDSVSGWTPDILPRVSWLKVNAAELRALEPVLAASSAKPSLLVTDGAEPARLRDASGAWSCRAPRVESIGPVVNPIGAGDAATAVFTDGLLRGLDGKAAAARALAAASASCLHPLPSEWKEGDMERLEKDVRWEAETTR